MKKLYLILPLALILCFMVGCQDKEAMAELEAMKAQAELEEQNKELVRNFFEELDKGNAEIVNELYSPDVKSYWPSGSTIPVSQKDLFEMTKTYLNDFPDLNHTIEELIAKEDKVIIRFIARGTHQDGLGGIPATGNKMELSAITILRFENGKVVESRCNNSDKNFGQKINSSTPPASP